MKVAGGKRVLVDIFAEVSRMVMQKRLCRRTKELVGLMCSNSEAVLDIRGPRLRTFEYAPCKEMKPSMRMSPWFSFISSMC